MKLLALGELSQNVFESFQIFSSRNSRGGIQQFFCDEGLYHVETSPANQWTGFYMIGISVIKELLEFTWPKKNIKRKINKQLRI